jgi:RNA polymerase sigma factor (sigma-70 family)
VDDFEALFLEHWAPVYRRLVRLVGDPAEAEDLALETFMRLYQRPPEQRNGATLTGWLYRVATNLGLHSLRSHRRRERYEWAAGRAALDEAPSPQPAGEVADEEERQATRAVLAQMKERQARLLILRYSGMSYKEIAAAMGLSPASIGPLLVRAEREFEKRYRARTG